MSLKESAVMINPHLDIREKEVSVTAFRRRPGDVYRFIETLGNVVVFTKRGKRDCVIMSIETYAMMTGRYEETLAEIETLCETLREKGISHGQGKGSQPALCPDAD